MKTKEIVDRLKSRCDPRIVFPDELSRDAIQAIERLESIIEGQHLTIQCLLHHFPDLPDCVTPPMKVYAVAVVESAKISEHEYITYKAGM